MNYIIILLSIKTHTLPVTNTNYKHITLSFTTPPQQSTYNNLSFLHKVTTTQAADIGSITHAMDVLVVTYRSAFKHLLTIVSSTSLSV